MENNLYFYSEGLDLYAHLFHEGTNDKAYEFFGAHMFVEEDRYFTRFVVWAPNAKYVNLCGDFNSWHEFNLPMKRISDSGVWEISVFDVEQYDAYKYRIVTEHDAIIYKADPFAFHAELRPKTASKVYDIKNYEWKDSAWQSKAKKKDPYHSPMSIYEVNLSSWKKHDDGNPLSYQDYAQELVDYVKQMGFTHVEFMPITEYPFDGSWGYQVTGYFAPTSRFGSPKDFMYLVDRLHQNNIGVILDWVPVHFCADAHGLCKFDGSAQFEHWDPRYSFNEQWGTINFDYSKAEVVNFLISSALFWHEYYHIDGIRVDAVAYILYTDFVRKDIKNDDGSNINHLGVEFIKKLNTKVYEYYPETMMIAEESTAWPNITMPIEDNGMGFGFKWNMGWMNDILKYMKMDPFMRKFNHEALTFTMTYAFSENYILPFSHDEVVHMKGSMLNKIHGDYGDRFKQLRLLYLYQYTHPGKKLLFMGDEFAQFDEWNEWTSLSWNLLGYDSHNKLQQYVSDLNKLYKKEKALYEIDDSFKGFKWLEVDNEDESVIAYQRIAKSGEHVICIFNFTPVERLHYPIGIEEMGNYSIVINSDHQKYGGDTQRNKYYRAIKKEFRDWDQHILVDIPAFGALILKKKIK